MSEHGPVPRPHAGTGRWSRRWVDRTTGQVVAFDLSAFVLAVVLAYRLFDGEAAFVGALAAGAVLAIDIMTDAFGVRGWVAFLTATLLAAAGAIVAGALA